MSIHYSPKISSKFEKIEDMINDLDREIKIMNEMKVDSFDTVDISIDHCYVFVKTIPKKEESTKIILGTIDSLVGVETDLNMDEIKSLYTLFKKSKTKYGIKYSGISSIPITYYNVEIEIGFKRVDYGISTSFTLKKIEKNTNIQSADPRVFNIIKDMPYLSGLVGISGKYIPIVSDSHMIIEHIKKISNMKLQPHPSTNKIDDLLSLPVNLEQFIPGAEIYAKLPVVLHGDKLFFEFETPPKGFILASSTKELSFNDGLRIKHNTTIVPIIISKISDYFSKKGEIFSENATFLNNDIIEGHEKEIKILLESDPMKSNELKENTGMSLDMIEKYMKMYGYILSRGIKLGKRGKILVDEILKITDIRQIEEDPDIIQKIIGIIAFHHVLKGEKHGSGEILKEINESILVNHTIEPKDFTEYYISNFGYSQTKTSKIIDMLLKEEILSEDEKGNFIYGDNVMPLLKR
jgi:hypothetical protein